jgi:hypothetical protein
MPCSCSVIPTRGTPARRTASVTCGP